MVSGFVIAFVTLLLFGFVIPRVHARKAILADAPLGERFSEDLRIVRTPSLAIEGDGERGTIFTTERRMSTDMTGSGKASPTRKVPTVARDRSRAKARVSQRAAYRVRGLLGGGVLGLVTLTAWIAVAVTSFPDAIAIAATVMTGAFAVGLGFFASEWAKADDVDIATIERATQVLATAKRRHDRAVRDMARNRPDSAVRTSRVAVQQAPEVSRAETLTDGVTGGTIGALEQTQDARTSSPTPQPAVKASSAKAPAVKPPATKKVAAPAPSYTLKPAIQRRVVKPYEAPVEESGAVPYRPKHVGERLGHAHPEAPNAAPVMTGEEELRADLLGGGSTLDKLLEQRRA